MYEFKNKAMNRLYFFVKIAIITLILVVVSFDSTPKNFTIPLYGEIQPTETYVYICTGPKATRYHSSSKCRGLSNCSDRIEKVTLTYAKSKNRTACKLCFKN